MTLHPIWIRLWCGILCKLTLPHTVPELEIIQTRTSIDRGNFYAFMQSDKLRTSLLAKMLSSGGVAQGHTLAPATTRSPLSTPAPGMGVCLLYETAEWTTLYLSLISSRTTFDFLPLLQCHCCHLLLLIWLKLKTEAAFISLIVSHKIASRKLKLRKSVNLKDGLNIAKYSVI